LLRFILSPDIFHVFMNCQGTLVYHCSKDNQIANSPLLRHIALTLAFAVAWLGLAPALASAQTLPQNVGHVRPLAPAEMRNITGAQHLPPGMGNALPVSPESGDTLPWEGSSNGTNTGNGNKLTSLPLVGRNTRGDLPMAFTLYHNSQSTYNDEIGQKRTHSFDNLSICLLSRLTSATFVSLFEGGRS